MTGGLSNSIWAENPILLAHSTGSGGGWLILEQAGGHECPCATCIPGPSSSLIEGVS